jgi:hypothetical protein
MGGPSRDPQQEALAKQQQQMLNEQASETRAKKEELTKTRLDIIKAQGGGSFAPTLPKPAPTPGPRPQPNPFKR